MTDLEAIYTAGEDLGVWDKANTPEEGLIYRDGMSEQIGKMAAVATLLPNYSQDEVCPPKVVGAHLSKSVGLPVACFKFAPYGQVSAYVFVRDNFHDLKVVVVSDSPIFIPYHVMYREWSQEKYDAEVERYVNYKGDERPPEGSDDWYSANWSSGTILRKDGRIYRAGSHQEVYCEGINKLGLPAETFKPYEDGMQSFVCEVGSYATVATILECVVGSLEKERSKRNEERRQMEQRA